MNSVEDPIDYTSAEHKILMSLFFSVSEVERDKISLRTKQNMQHSKENGYWCGTSPFGFNNYRDQNGKSTLIPNEDAKLVKLFLYYMRIVSKSTLIMFWQKTEYEDAEQQLNAWYKVITSQDWKDPHEIISYFQDADQVGNGRIVFNICRNKYMLIVFFRYKTQIGYIRFMGTHKQYDQIKDIKNI